MNKHADIYLEAAELLEFDFRTGNIKVDKQIFDVFVPNSYIKIIFTDDRRQDRVAEYIMTDEDDEGIFMKYLDDIA